ncbi:unnamed protein product [Cylicocyclus nassatus]|uniref:5'-3' exoribonuclease 1 n=1 Tax=Cylicocyclus nassatus TaxID=53992 RepID=A0AA36HA98_CYLNA|nr:unnamed protein product [Cylicocyclus nassatus]
MHNTASSRHKFSAEGLSVFCFEIWGEVISDTEIPEFDNLYLDMNGIIHNCSHPNDDDFKFRISQEQIFADIFAYIDKLFNIIRPKKVFFLAVDGVAPRAKMNQQRARRFMSARTAEEQLQAHIRKGEELPKEKRFDSNCITPGTLFMAELHEQLAKWLEKKVEKDPAWHGIRVFLSGHDCPGEGEHKIMDFIRHERTLDGYDPNTRHCMYGLDADLLMLGICSHEPHFSLLREEVKFTRPPKSSSSNPKRVNPSQINFHLLHLSLLREYLSWEFYPLKATLPFPYDMERIIDDWVLMGFLIGNDFIPHLPYVHIHDDALPLLYKTYIQVLPTLKGYINESGVLNLERFEIFLKAFAANDRRHFLQTLEDESFLRSKTGRDPHGLFTKEEETDGKVDDEKAPGNEASDSAEPAELSSDDEAAFISSDEDESDSEDIDEELPDGGVESAADLLSRLKTESDTGGDDFDALMAAELREMDDKEFENDVENCWTKTVSNSFRRHKRLYYREKMKYENITKAELRQQAEGYVRAIQWNLHYYYKGCVSWNWFYPHHYSPYISDVVDFSNVDMNFELGEPFKPFEQLLAVLPSASAECLPPPFRDLMCDKDSPIADFYPTDFRTDLNGKKNDWEAVVLIPFIDEARLLDAVKTKMPLLTPAENARNAIGSILLFKCEALTPLKTQLPVDTFHLESSEVKWGLLSNVKLDVFFPGFPTMKHLPHTAELKQVNVKVFQQESKRPSMVLSIGKREELEKESLELAKEYIGKEVCIDWPLLKIGLVDSFWIDGNKYSRQEDGEVTAIALDENEQEVLKTTLTSQKERMLSRYAINVNNAKAVAFVRHFAGVTYAVEQGVLHPQKQWVGPQAVVPVLLPLLVTNVKVDSGVSLRDIPVSEAYPKHSKVFAMLPSWEGFGYPALVDTVDPNGRVRLTVSIWPTIDLCGLRNEYNAYSLPWMNSFDAGRKIGVDGRLLSRITGTVFLVYEQKPKDDNAEGARKVEEKINIGLSLKLSKRNQEVPDYTRRLENGYWQYSILCIQLLTSYRNKFRDLFAFLEKSHTVDDAYSASDIWTNEEKREQRVADLKEFLANVPTNGIEKQEGGKQYADRLIIGKIENALKELPKKRWGFRKCSINPSVLYKAELYDGKCCADPDADFHVLDRVVYTIQGRSVPFGCQGTVVGVSSGKVDVLFDHEFNGGYKMRGAMNSGACVPKTSLINITYAKERKGRKPEALLGEAEKRLSAGKEQQREGCRKMMMLLRKNAAEANKTSFANAPFTLLTRKPRSEKSVTETPTTTPSSTAAILSQPSGSVLNASSPTTNESSHASMPMATGKETQQELVRKMMMLLRKNAEEAGKTSSAKSPITLLAKKSQEEHAVMDCSSLAPPGTAAKSIQSSEKDLTSTTLSSSTNVCSQSNTPAVSKQQMEDELNRMLGLKSGRSDINAQSDIVANLTTPSPLPAEHEDATPAQQMPTNALAKLFPAAVSQTDENKEAIPRVMSAAAQNVTPVLGCMRSDSFPVPRRGNFAPRGSTQRRPPQGRQYVTNPLFQPVDPQPAKHDFFGSSRAVHNSSPKLTDLKPASVVLPSRQPRRRKGGKQPSGPAKPPQQQNVVVTVSANVTTDYTTPVMPARAAANAVNKDRRARKSRLAPKFAGSS